MGQQQSCCCTDEDRGEAVFGSKLPINTFPALQQPQPRTAVNILGGYDEAGNNPKAVSMMDSKKKTVTTRLPDGSTYKGEINARGQKHGEGTLQTLQGGTYTGQFQFDRKEGFGRSTEPSSSKGGFGNAYEGQWKQDRQHGQGTIKWEDGSIFEGTFANGDKNGEGRFSWADGSTFSGQFARNVMNGRGTYKWADSMQYSGQWSNNVMQGGGEMWWPDGRHFKGQFMNGHSHGEGTMSWPDGREYRGQWAFGKQHGVGFMTDDKLKISSKTEWNGGVWVRNLA
mmetsp:Transcript_36863/g.88724  ORF Transcript_36863/g.88724 Transcript_36863/m.88724 type:complete len:283 (+) Transcript_36863:52-900(+)